jgi:hypothetical protein
LRKPARLQPREFAVLAQPRKRPVDGLAQRPVFLGERDPELFAGRHLERDRQLRAVLHQPRDNREQFDHQTDAPGLEVVEGGRDAVIRIVLDIRDGAFRQQPLGDEIRGVAGLDAGGQTTQIAQRGHLRPRAVIHRHALVEFEIGLRKQRNSGALGSDRRPGDDGIVATRCETVENSVEVGARIPHRLQDKPELRANRAHQLDVEAARRAALDDIEGRIGIGRRHGQSPRNQRQCHGPRRSMSTVFYH